MDPLIRVLNASNRLGSDASLETTVLVLLLAFVLGQLVAWTYMWTHSGLSYSRTFSQAIVLMSMVVALVMCVIGNNIITAFGLLGALALIRFRNVLKDTRDTVFVFIALVVGMAVGTQRFFTAIAGTIAIVLTAIYLSKTSFGTPGYFDGYLTVRLAGGETPGWPGLENLMSRFCRKAKRISMKQYADQSGREIVYQVGLRDRNRSDELVENLKQVQGVEAASIVLRDEMYEV